MSQYVITDGSRFIYRNHQNKYVPAPGEGMADIFSRKQAEGILNNSLPKPLRMAFHVERYDVPPAHVKQVSPQDLKENTEKLKTADNIKIWVDKISNFNGLVSDASQRKDILEVELQGVEQEILDCLHYIEFCNLNASQGYSAYKMLKERRIKRRKIKNELAVLSVILNAKISKSVADEVNRIINQMDKRTYEPRVLTELFDL